MSSAVTDVSRDATVGRPGRRETERLSLSLVGYVTLYVENVKPYIFFEDVERAIRGEP